ncbi:MAG TPA: hypothetical protein VGS22_00295 [Thermoanaerobaculia bacterium]|jgi:hypothetical protein|nr:hypothetical protein [Thermoanaerobaculia bacterium]
MDSATHPANAPLAPPLSPPLPPPPPPPPPPPLSAADRLVLAIHDATRPQGPKARRDPHGIGDRLRRASVDAADLLSRLDPDRPEGRPRTLRLGELAEARSRLAEVAYYVDLGERLGTLDPCEALELFELGLAASVDLAGRLDRLIYARADERPGRAGDSFAPAVTMRVEIPSVVREALPC